MRVFIAIDLPDEIKESIANIENEVRGKDVDVKFVEPKNLHITLKFLGEVNEEKVKEIEETVSDCVKEIKMFTIKLQGIGYFGSENYIKTLWINIREGKDTLIEIIKMLDKGLDHIRKDNYQPNPHLTIGRVRSGRNKEILLDETKRLKDVKVGEIQVKQIKLKKSELTPKGPIYTDLYTINLVNQGNK